ncbi:CNH domain-containing protein [Mycena kentingensis (nom. inval.)]|nr:CNH domain-containing protein [Mycena kentingensis (nom. inval.)]
MTATEPRSLLRKFQLVALAAAKTATLCLLRLRCSPLEIIERIIDFLHAAKNALLACALVSRATLPTSCFHLRALLPVLPEVWAERCHKVTTATLLADGGTLYGTNECVYYDGRQGAKMEKVLRISCAQIEVLESHDMLLILSGRRLLKAPLHLAVGPRAHYGQLQDRLEVLSSDVSFFQVGDHVGKRVVCIVNAGRFTSHFAVLEAVHRDGTAKLAPFRSFYLPEHARSVHIWNKTIGASLKNNGFQCVDPTSLMTFPLPVATQARPEPEDAGPRKCRAMFRADDARFLLCYDRCAFFMDKAGLSAEHEFALRWNKGESAKQFAFVAPFLLVFVPNAMQVWRIDSGEKVQTVWSEGMQMVCATPRVLVRMGDGRIVRLQM